MKSPFLQEVRDNIRIRHYSIRTEETYLYWIRFFIRFKNNQHPKNLDGKDIREFLNFLALERQVAPSTQKTALNALVFMFKQVLKVELEDFADFHRARSPKKLPTVLTRNEIDALFSRLSGNSLLAAGFMYGSGLRVMETVRLRVQDIDLNRLCVFVRDGKGRKQRITTLSQNLVAAIERQIAHVHALYDIDCADAIWDGVYLPSCTRAKIPQRSL